MKGCDIAETEVDNNKEFEIKTKYKDMSVRTIWVRGIMPVYENANIEQTNYGLSIRSYNFGEGQAKLLGMT